ncbi:hypothetical protein U1Q18_002204 [Sarracenia purpurea var. burkii]
MGKNWFKGWFSSISLQFGILGKVDGNWFKGWFPSISLQFGFLYWLAKYRASKSQIVTQSFPLVATQPRVSIDKVFSIPLPIPDYCCAVAIAPTRRVSRSAVRWIWFGEDFKIG